MDKKQIVIADIFADEEIIARITGGEKEFYARLIKKYNAQLYRIAITEMLKQTLSIFLRNYCSNHADA